MLRPILAVLFPARCVGCGGAGWPFCGRCGPNVARFSAPWCERCGRPLDRPVDSCRDCPPGGISWARSAFLYDGPARRALMRLKFGGARHAVEALSGPMADALASSPAGPSLGERPGRDPQEETRSSPWDAPFLTWVPLGTRRRRTRGFDQAEALARAVGRRAGLPVRPALERTRETPPQARRSGPERRAALRGAFRARANAMASSRIVLVDDVLTSGSTAAECAAVLRRAGAREVGVLTAARSLGGPVPARCYTPGPGPGLGLWLPGGSSPGSRCQSQAKRPT